MYVYVQSEPNLWTVGYYTPSGKWMPESDYPVQADAIAHMRWLNGASLDTPPGPVTPPSPPPPASAAAAAKK